MTDYPLVTQLPPAGPGVAPSIEEIIRQVQAHHGYLTSEAARLGVGVEPNEAEQTVSQAALTTRIMAVLAMRLDPDVSKRLHKLAAEMDRDRYRMQSTLISPDEARQNVTTAMALGEGLMIATLIDGPARGSATVNVVAQAHAHATATAQVTAVAEIERIAAEVRASDDIPDDIAVDLDDLKTALEDGEDPASLLTRLGVIADKAGPFVTLASSIASLAGQLLS